MGQSDYFVVRASGTEAFLQDPTEAKKALEAIDIRLTNRPITLLQHKIYNVWIAFAQSMPNPAETRIFEFPLSEVMELCGFDSNNHAYFIDAAREMLGLRVEYNSLARYREQEVEKGPPPKRGGRRKREAIKWSAAQLVSFIEIDSASNSMRIEFPEILRQEILRPDFYRAIDLRKQQLFSSRAGLTLYEYVLRYAAEQATPWLPWQSYSMLLSGAIEPHKTFREFSKMLQRALEQVNAHHETHGVQAEFTKRGRAIEKMRLLIALKHQRQLGLESAAEAPPDLVRAIVALGLSTREANAIALAHPRPYLEAQITYVRRRLADRERGGIKVPAAYFRAAVSGNYAGFTSTGEPATAPPVASAAALPVPTSSPTTPSAAANTPVQAPVPSPFAETRAWYSGLAEEVRAELAATFLSQATPLVRQAIERRGMESPIAANTFYGWLRALKEQH